MTGLVVCTLSHKTRWRNWVFWRDAMKFSRESDYALRGLPMLACRPPEYVTMLADIAKAEGPSNSFLSKILQRAARETSRPAAAARETSRAAAAARER